MKGDLSRQTFKADKHYSGVAMQQGRVQLDADWNEQQAINRHRTETESADVIGPSGAPKTCPGFRITAQGNDLQIAQGHFYVDGILCENERDVLFTAQPDLRPIDAGLLPTTAGLYVAYLEVWERHITALEDATIRETALGGPDTATRTQTVWQVRLLPVADPGGTITCATVFPEWTQLLRRNLIGIPDAGRLSARSQPEEPSPDPRCILPPGAGYRRLENQLYRVEIHRGGERTQARFKWSRDNGTVASAIRPADGGVISGSVIEVAELGKDGLLTFASDPLPEWLELTDDRYELLSQRGELARVQAVDPATRTITFAPGPLPALAAGQHPLVRRWDQRGATATDQGVAMTGDWQPLEDGVEVRFEDGLYREGDFWLIPARTAIGFETGTVEWPREGANPLPQTPQGTQHHLARLALLRLDAGAFTPVAGADCRPLFPPLTALTAADVGFSDATCQLGNVTNVQQALDALCQRNASICSLLVGPGEDLAAALNRLAGAQDALICLRVGTYPLTQPLRIENRRHIQIVGAGPGTRIVAAQSETALLFDHCTSVQVSQLYVETGVAGRGNQASAHLNGTLTFLSCASVTVENTSVHCAGGPLRAATCITVRHPGPAAGSQARIHGCDLEVGHLQAGLLLVNVERSRVTDNRVRAVARPADNVLLQDIDYRATLRRQLISGVVAGTPPTNTNATVTFNNQVVHFRSDPALVRGSRNDTEWQRAINAVNPAGITSAQLLKRFLLRLAGDLLRTRGGGAGGSRGFRTVIDRLLAQDTPATAEQAIVLAGEVAAGVLPGEVTRDVQISGNTVHNAIQGIHVGLGLGHLPDPQGTFLIPASLVLIENNTIQVNLPSSATRDRYGIFVGHCQSLVIQSNYLSVRRQTTDSVPLRVEGMRLFGILGPRVIVRHNHMARFEVGVTFAPLNTRVPPQPLWIVTENEMEGATAKVDVPAKRPPQQPPQPGVPDPAAVRQRIRGLNDNFS